MSVTSMTPLIALLVSELLIFSITGKNFATATNAAEIGRLSVELGLIAVSMTAVILAGGIDLSVGSLLGLCAVCFGIFTRDCSLSWPIASLLTLAVGLAGGGFNGWLIAGARISPLIATLGTMSLYRGLAEGLTGGVDNFTGFPESFLQLGQGYWATVIPFQLPILLVVTVLYAVLVHATIWGRWLVVIGLSPDGAKYAAIPVNISIASTYVGVGLATGLAAVIYVAHVGQAKADAGTGYELFAITAVVLGGTSLAGGQGGIPQTFLGLIAIAMLTNGLRLSDWPSELSGILTGLVLLTTIYSQRKWDRGFDSPIGPQQAEDGTAVTTASHPREDWNMKNGQLAALCATILLAAGVIAASNWWLVQSLQRSQNAAGHLGVTDPKSLDETAGYARQGSTPEPLTIAMMPKSKGNAYFIACRQGAEDAAAELGVTLLWDGPTEPDPAKQNEVVDTWITRGVDGLAIAVENRDAMATVLRKARTKGIPVVTWDSDTAPDARQFFVNQATPAGIAQTLMDNAARVLGGKGSFAIITGSLTAGNMVAWQKEIERVRQTQYPDLTMAVLRPCDDQQKKAFDEANVILGAYPNVKLLMAICSPAMPGAAEAVKQSGRNDVKVLGLGLPNDSKRFVKEGITDCVILWNTRDLGYLTVYAIVATCRQELRPGMTTLKAGRLGSVTLDGDHVLLGKPFAFTRENIDQYDF